MNSYERLFARMEGKPVDRLPNLNIVMMFAARQIGVPYGKYVTDHRLLAEGVWKCYEKFGIDCLCAISDPMREAEGLGAKVVIPEDDVPYSQEFLVTEISDIEKLKPIDPSLGRRMNDRLEAVRLLKEKSGGEVPVIGWVEGAVAECCDLMNISQAMVSLLDYPDEMNQMLALCEEQSERFALAQIQAGADIIGVGDAASSLIGPGLYEEFALPWQQKLISAIHNAGAKVKLHICGNLNPVLDLVAQTGADIVDCDHMVDIQEAVRVFPKNMSACGNFDPVSVLLSGTPELVKQEVLRCSNLGVNNNLIAAGCEVPKFTPEENMFAVMEALG
ncbi:MAG: uroporphyrinogen decarboxylase family protein [Massiliimalia sp.]|jgi:MtaA/CmuA family methyltransferase